MFQWLARLNTNTGMYTHSHHRIEKKNKTSQFNHRNSTISSACYGAYGSQSIYGSLCFLSLKPHGKRHIHSPHRHRGAPQRHPGEWFVHNPSTLSLNSIDTAWAQMEILRLPLGFDRPLYTVFRERSGSCNNYTIIG